MYFWGKGGTKDTELKFCFLGIGQHFILVPIELLLYCIVKSIGLKLSNDFDVMSIS